ncbi:Cysteine desulfurase [Planctomycetes bacterium Pan216]|uniref:Cysteine desulfurase IscS n=1 Tax=Kolteria novifilia TaxID=2527975 RepID=A0A518B3D2_9BACT|nr:Cysteine desulfurase [Planctomycetes bacterium Pan216]
MVMLPIYMDNSATTRTDPRVVEKMLPYFTEEYGNSASRNHRFGWRAEEAVDKSRTQIGSLIGASPKEIIFTSGSTESNNLAIKGVAHMYRRKGDHIITCLTEHKAVLDPCKRLEKEGFNVTYLPVDRFGCISIEQLEEAITDKTILVTLMFANNEIGTIHQIPDIGKLCHDKGIVFHTDATQAVGKIPVDVEAMGIDLLSLSGHKMYGPKGVGALYVRRKNPRVRLDAIIDGGGHERGMRSGTLAVTNIVGLGMACEICEHEMPEEMQRLGALRDKLEEGIRAQLTDVELNGHPTNRLPQLSNLSFAYVEGEALMMGVKDVAVSSGSACTSASLEPSYILKALGVGDELAHSSLRFSLGRFNTEEEVDFTINQVVEAVNHLRQMSPLYEMAQEGIDLSTVEWSGH